jgi:hypothetical protein
MLAGLKQLGVSLRPAPTRTVDAAEAEDASSSRSFDAWDVLGVLATIALAGVIATGGAVRGNPGYNWLPEALFVLAFGCALVTGAGSFALARRQSLDLELVPHRLMEIWLDPPRDWVMFGVGFLCALPALALHTDVIGDTDSARIISSTMYVERNGLGYLVETQDNLLPHVTVGPLVALGGIAAATFFSILSVQALAGSISYLAWKITGSTAATFAAAVSLLAFPITWQRANLLPLYPLMLAFGLLGLYFAQRATVLTGRQRMWSAILAGTSFVLSLEAHRLGQFFLAFSLFLFLSAPWRRAAAGLARVYAVVVILSIPRIIINLWSGGLDHFLSNRVDYWITEGYLVRVQKEFFKSPATGDYASYFSHLAGNLDSLFSWGGVLVLMVGLASIALIAGPPKRFVLACVGVFVVALLYRKVPFYERYFSPLMVAGALGVGIAASFLLRRGWALKGAALALIVAVLASALIAYGQAVNLATQRQKSTLRGPLPTLAGKIDDGKGVIGSRVTQLLFVDPEIRTFDGQFLSEDDYVTYLTWPSDQEVINMLRAWDIGWVLISPRPRREIDYHNTWLQWAHGKSVRHVARVAASPNFCEVLSLKGYLLYKLGPCVSAT